MSNRHVIFILLLLMPASVPAATTATVPGPLGPLASLLITVVIIIATVIIHYGGLNLIIHVCDSLPGDQRARIAETVTAILMLHIVEIMLFAAGFRLLAWDDPGGGLVGADGPGWGEYFYYSSTVYTTVGFGDLVPIGGLRILTAFASLTGLVMITWSASLTFVEMQRAWDRDGHRPRVAWVERLFGRGHR